MSFFGITYELSVTHWCSQVNQVFKRVLGPQGMERRTQTYCRGREKSGGGKTDFGKEPQREHLEDPGSEGRVMGGGVDEGVTGAEGGRYPENRKKDNEGKFSLM